jgi:predicted metal-dependent phosphoesterase TrpH
MTGLHFHKLDLHVHTPASDCYLQKTHTPEEIVQAALDKELSAIAITDHNTAAWIDTMKQAGEAKGIVIFPGVEISLEAGYHLVAIFDPGIDQKHVESFLGAIDITPKQYGKPDAYCKKNVYEVIAKIHERNGLAILAHIDQLKGAFKEQTEILADGKIRVPITCSGLFNEALYDAVECADGTLPAGFDIEHHFKRFPAVYQASDNPDIEQPSKHSLEGIGNRHSWFKLDQLCIPRCGLA